MINRNKRSDGTWPDLASYFGPLLSLLPANNVVNYFGYAKIKYQPQNQIKVEDA